MGKFVSERNLKFLIYEVLQADSLAQYDYYSEHGKEVFDIVLETALKLGRDLLQPYLAEMDRNPPVLEAGAIKVHPIVKTYVKESGEGGWIAANAPFEVGGQQLPTVITNACLFIFAAANYSLSVYPTLTTGAAHLIESFGSQDLIETYVPKMFSGDWQGTMALTEPQAGSSLSDVTTQAEPTDEGYFKIRGQKIFISASDHDASENIVHLMLARIKGAPLGTKGISLFIVPKLRLNAGGNLEHNDVNVAGMFHKLGYRGAPIAQLSMGENDDCRGYLVGEPNKGLIYMFQMMNEARIGVGIGATAIASAAYYCALQYAQERPQGRKPTNKDVSAPQVPIIEHADVKRMLLFQKSVVEGSLSLLLRCSMYWDLSKVANGSERDKYALLLDILTPIAKSYPSEMGVVSVSQSLQCLGGYGYCDEFPVEQFYRDARIHPIHEGTTGIQGMDLLGRKVIMRNGAAFYAFMDEVKHACDIAMGDGNLKLYGEKLAAALEKLVQVTTRLISIAQNPQLFLADSVLYLEMFSLIAIAWQWLIQGICASEKARQLESAQESNFYNGKLQTMKYFFHYELPKIEGLAIRLLEADGLTMNTTVEMFAD